MQRKRKKSEKKESPSFFQEYRFEITITSMIILGVFLLIENMEISQTIFVLLKTLIFLFADVIKSIRKLIYDIFYWLEISDLVGVLLILLAGFLVAIRTRVRLLSKYQKINECQKCDGQNKLKRIKKKLKHRIIDFILRLRVYYYQCDNCYKKQLVVLMKRR